MPRRGMDDRRVADYFVVAGLDPSNQRPLEEFSNDAIAKSSSRLDPITDITVINRSLGEKVPKGFECLELTPTGYPANLNHASFRCPDMFICYKRGLDKPPLKDLGVLYEGKERLMEGCEVVHTTTQGNPANVNNSTTSRTYLTYRRADKLEPSDTLVVVDICIILGNRGEDPPLTFLQVYKNLNKGMIGSDVFLCYKKAVVKKDFLAYKASILGRYPEGDYEDFPLPDPVPMFCLPMGATIECWSAEAQHPVPSFSTFILTGANGEKVYGAAVGFYEEYKEADLSDSQMRALGLKNKLIREQYDIRKTVHVRKSISLLSHWPLFDAFKKFLTQLYKISITGPHTVPLERHISHFMYDVPYPSPERPRILVQLTHDSLSLCMPEDSPLPQSGASFITLLRNLAPEHTMTLLLFVLLENKILLHSLRPTVLTEVAEAVSTMVFPFHWQCPYIPLCPLGLSDVLNAPCPFIVGVDSRYFDLFDPPGDVICVDLDTNRIVAPENKKTLNYKLLPKRATRVMHESLLRLYDVASRHMAPNNASEEVSLELTHFDLDFKRKKQTMQLELAIQEVFLRFTASCLKDYKNYLNPIMKQPTFKSTDASSLFDMQSFLKSRDKANAKFFSQMMRTQMFFRFIEERSFVSDKDACLAFFDECTEKVDELGDDPKLIETDNTQTSERTIFIMPPEPDGLPEGVTYRYNGFPSLKPELFLQKQKSHLSLPTKPPGCPNSPLARRTKQEVKSAQKIATQQVRDPEAWSKCLLSYCYSLWFVVFPAYVQSHPKKMDALKTGFAVLKKMQDAKLKTVDEVCYRVLMQLAGQYNKPGLAVQVFYQMKKHKVIPNAITYGYYNKVMLEAEWPTPKSKAKLRWMKIRIVIIGVAQFRRNIRRRSQSIYSNSGSEYDQISRASMDSFEGQGQTKPSQLHQGEAGDLLGSHDTTSSEGLHKKNGSMEEKLSTGGASDRGYNSMTQEDAKRLSQIVSSSDTSSSGSPATSENSGRSEKSKQDFWASPPTCVLVTPRSRPHSFRGKKEIHVANTDKRRHSSGRARQGSIVRKSAPRSAHISEYDLLKGSIFCNSSGLVILSQAGLEKSVIQTNTDFHSEVEAAKRKRHKSAVEKGSAKPSRSMSIFAGWKPGKNTAPNAQGGGTSEDQKLQFRFSDLMKTDKKSAPTDPLNIVDGTSGSDSFIMDSLQSEKKCDSNVQDGPSMSDNSMVADSCIVEEKGEKEDDSSMCSIVNNATDSSRANIVNNSVSAVSDEVTKNAQESECVSTANISNEICLEFDPLADKICRETTSHPLQEDSSSSVNASHKSQPANLTTDSDFHSSESDPISSSVKTQSDSISLKEGCSNQEDSLLSVNKRDMRRSVSISEDQFSAQLMDSPMKQSYSAIGSTLSSHGTDPSIDQKTPVKHTSEDAQSISSLTDPKRERPSDFVLRRSQSLKKTNDAIGSFLKYASKAAFTKLNELKQTITTPIKNGSLGSLSSLTQSVEELDGNDGSSTSGTIKERLRYGGSQDLLSHSEESETDQSDKVDKRNSGLSFGSAPSPSFLEGYRDVSNAFTAMSTTSMEKLITVAMEVEMSSCSRCTNPRCSRLLYDEEIMAGWSAEDSNLNTSCPYCKSKFVPHLQVYIKDWRSEEKSLMYNSEREKGENKFMFQSDPLGVTSTGSPGAQENPANKQSSLDSGDKLLTLGEAANSIRRRCTSECLTAFSDNATDGFPSPTDLAYTNSPLTLSIDESMELSTSPVTCNSMKRDFMSRSASSSEPIVIAYLSPLVLRKEVEYILDHEGDLALASESFVEEHPIIFWNLVWFFRRIEVKTHLTGFLLTSKAFPFNKVEPVPTDKVYNSDNILIRPQWDNVRIHDEAGLPMYKAWQEGHKSTVLNAIVTESASFSQRVMWDIISSIKRNNVIDAIKLVANGRRRIQAGKCRFRSMYREILFLSFIDCGRENIDHDAFDMEYSLAFEKRLNTAERRRLQPDDQPKSLYVQACRRAFCDLEV